MVPDNVGPGLRLFRVWALMIPVRYKWRSLSAMAPSTNLTTLSRKPASVMLRLLLSTPNYVQGNREGVPGLSAPLISRGLG